MSEEGIRRRMTASETEELRHLTERVGVTRREAELMLENDDLWTMLVPEERFVHEDPEEEARKWEEASLVLYDAGTLVLWHSEAPFVAIVDAASRCNAAAERAKARVRETSAE